MKFKKSFALALGLPIVMIGTLFSAPLIANAISVNWNRTAVGTEVPQYSVDGILVTASSTIGSNTRASGLTVNGGATTTQDAYFATHVGIGVQPDSNQLNVLGTGLFSGLFTADHFVASGNTATSTYGHAIYAPCFSTDNATCLTAGGLPGGSDTQVQFNDGGSTFGGAIGFVWDKVNRFLGIGTTTPSAILSVQATTTAQNLAEFDTATSSNSYTQNTTTYTSGQTWTKPAGLDHIDVTVIAGGGGGGGGGCNGTGGSGGIGSDSSFTHGGSTLTSTHGTGGSPGAGCNNSQTDGTDGQSQSLTISASGLNATETITVGAGGGGGGGASASGQTADNGGAAVGETGGAGGAGRSASSGTAGGNAGVDGTGHKGAKGSISDGGSGAQGGSVVITTYVLNTPTQSTATTTAFKITNVTSTNGTLLATTTPAVGIGTSTPWATFSVQSFWGVPARVLASFIGAVNYTFEEIDKWGHILTGGPAPTANSCTGFSISGDDRTGRITYTSATTCSFTFANAYSAAPVCTITPETSASTIKAVPSTTGVAVTFGTAQTSFSYICQQHQ